MKRKIFGIAGGIICCTVITVAAVWGFGVWRENAPSALDKDSAKYAEEDSGRKRTRKEKRKKEPEEIKESYPAPEYPFKTDEISVVIEGLERDYRIAFVNDVHMITDHTSGDVTEDNMAIVSHRYETFAVTEEGIPAEELWPEIVKYLNYQEFDAVIFGGDIIDYCSNSNINALNDGIRELKYPRDRIMYLRSDHDYVGGYGGNGFTDANGYVLQTYILDGDRTEKVIEFDDLIILGLNQSYKNVSEAALEYLEEKLDGDKPVILATHVPFYSRLDESLADCSVEARGKIYYWSEESPDYVPDERTQQLIDDLYDGGRNVAQIVAAHLHTYWDGFVTEDLKEHVFAPAFQGNIGIIHVTGAGGAENIKGHGEDDGDKNRDKYEYEEWYDNGGWREDVNEKRYDGENEKKNVENQRAE